MRKLYHALVSNELRFQLYKLRRPNEFRNIRSRVKPSPKGDFSLRAFDRHECLFIHITKCAGTSVAKSLFGELPKHYTAIQYRVIFGRRTFNRYFKFAFVRNPWDRLYSAYSYLKGGGWSQWDHEWFQKNIGHALDFNSFVLEWLQPKRVRSHIHFRPQTDFICDSRGRPLLDHLGYFETLREDFRHITCILGLKTQLVHVNASKRFDYRSVYTEDAIEKVRKLYYRDIIDLGYDFDGIKEHMTVCGGKLVAM